MSAVHRFLHLARPVGRPRLSPLLVLVLLSSDVPQVSPPTDVSYLGARTEQTDASFQKYAQALRARAGPGGPRFSLHYQPISDLDPVAIEKDVRRVLAAQPTIVVAPTGDSARAVVKHRGATQLVFASFPDPVQAGLVRSKTQPGAGVTGVSLADALHHKRLELLRDAYDSIKTVAVLADRSWWQDAQSRAAVQDAAASLGIVLQPVIADSEAELHVAMQALGGLDPDAWYIPATYLAYTAEASILAHLQRLGRPSMHTTLGEVARGAPMAYVQDTGFVFDALADLTHRVLRGVDAGSIPVQGPRQFILAVRPREAPAALRMNPSVIRRADRVY